MDVAARIILLIVASYAGVGVIVAIAFVTRGVGRVDPAARGSGGVFRLMIVPGCVALWPAILVKWQQANRRAGRST